MTEVAIVSVAHQDQTEIDRFLSQVYKREKAEFLRLNRQWWYKGGDYQFVGITPHGQVVAHSAIVPFTVRLAGKAVSALWWVDLVVLPEFRGRGIQTELDNRVRAAGDLKFAWPARELSAKMFQRHGWELRENSFFLSLPLKLSVLNFVRVRGGLKGKLLRAAVSLTNPLAALLRLYLSRYKSKQAYKLHNPDPNQLAAVYTKFNSQQDWVMTDRSLDYLRWRFLQSPYFDQYQFYGLGEDGELRLVLITRTLMVNGIKTTRLLDVFGDLDDGNGLCDLLRFAIGEAAQKGVDEIVAIASYPNLVSTLHHVGLKFSRKLLFCWHTDDAEKDRLIDQSVSHWTFADSDCDQ
jgi:hypothetical protein